LIESLLWFWSNGSKHMYSQIKLLGEMLFVFLNWQVWSMSRCAVTHIWVLFRWHHTVVFFALYTSYSIQLFTIFFLSSYSHPHTFLLFCWLNYVNLLVLTKSFVIFDRYSFWSDCRLRYDTFWCNIIILLLFNYAIVSFNKFLLVWKLEYVLSIWLCFRSVRLLRRLCIEELRSKLRKITYNFRLFYPF
jgi:hypothetical protein